MTDIAMAGLDISATTFSGNRSDRARKMRLAALLLAPSLVFLALFTYWPVAQVALQSLTVESFGGASHAGFDNFSRLFADPGFARAAVNNILYAAGTVGPSVMLALLFAVGLSESTRFSSLLRTIFVFPVLIPLVAAAALFSFVFQPRFGLLDHYLAYLGMGATNWIGNPDIALYSLMGITVWKNAGYYMLFFLAGLQAIPGDLHEAARVEGASAFQRFWRITLPLLRPTFAFVIVIALVQVLTNVDHVVLLTSGGPSNSTNLLLFYIYQQAHENYDIGLAAAATVVTVSALLAISVVSLRTLEHGIHYEG